MAIRRSINVAILVIGALSIISCGAKPNPSHQAAQKFTKLSENDRKQLEKQRGFVAAVAKQRYGIATLTKTKADLVTLQRLLDDKVFAKTQTYELQCIGVAFGDVLESELSLGWMMVTDEYGTDPTLRFKETTIQINVLTMISKRVEKDEAVDVSRLLEITREQLADVEKKLQK